MAEKRTIELEINSNAKTLKQQFKEAQQEVQLLSEKFGATSKQAIEAAKSAASLKDQIGDAKALTDAFNPDAKFKAVSASLTGVAGGFSVVTGAMGAFGTQSEEVEQALLKVQSAMAMASGLQAIGEAKDSFKQLGGVVKDTFTNLSSESSLAGKATSALGPVWKAVGLSGKTALNGIRAGIAATGIGLLVIALGAVVAYWDDIKSLVSGVTAEQDKQYESQKLLTAEAKLQYEAFDASVNSLILQGKTEKEIINLRKDKLFLLLQENKQDILNAEGRYKTEVEASKRNQKFLSYYFQSILMGMTSAGYVFTGIIDGVSNGVVFLVKKLVSFSQGFQDIMVDALVFPIETALKGVNELLKVAGLSTINVKGIVGDIKGSIKEINKETSNFVKGLEGTNLSVGLFDLTKNLAADPLSKLVFDPEEVAAEGKKTIEELKGVYQQNQSEYDGLRIDLQKIDKDANDKQNSLKADSLKTQEELIKQHNEKLTEYYDAIEAERQAKITDAREKELQDAANKYDELTLLADKAGQSTKEIDENYRTQLHEINKKFDDLDKIAKDEKTAKDKERLEKEKTFLESITLSENELKLAKLEEQYLAETLLYKDNAEILAALDKKYQKDKEALNKDTNDKIAAADKEAAEKKQALLNSQLGAVKDGLSAISNIAELFAGKSKASQKRAFNIQKATNIATATIDTFMSAQSAYKSLIGVPVVGPVIAPLAAAGAIAAGLINIKKIKATQFEGGTPPTDSSVPTAQTGGEPQAPQFNVVGNNGMNQLAQLQQQPVQAYVVSSEMTSAQALERNRINNATI
jgi:hypothetical protein